MSITNHSFAAGQHDKPILDAGEGICQKMQKQVYNAVEAIRENSADISKNRQSANMKKKMICEIMTLVKKNT